MFSQKILLFYNIKETIHLNFAMELAIYVIKYWHGIGNINMYKYIKLNRLFLSIT